jgi:hypothetical protein
VFSETSFNQFLESFDDLSDLKIKRFPLYLSPSAYFNVNYSFTAFSASIFIIVYDFSIFETFHFNPSDLSTISQLLLNECRIIANIASFNLQSIVKEQSEVINASFNLLFI